MNEPLHYSRRVSDLAPSPIRETLAILDKPGMISFAGGLPTEESFPEMDLGTLPRDLLQYGPTEGERLLRAAIADRLCEIGLTCSSDQVIVLSGSQQGIDLVAKLFIDPGTPILLESPTYLAALQVFRFFGARMHSFDRTRPEAIGLLTPRPAFAYVIPTFQNPTGHCYSAKERSAFAAACDENQIPVFEDDPYRDLAYDPCERRPISSSLKKAPWIYQGSFSKILAPGLRLGYLAASPELLPYLVRLKQAADLHSNRISQWIALSFLRDPGFEERKEKIVSFYRKKRDLFAKALAESFGEDLSWEKPSGGLFFWGKLSRDLDTRGLLPLSIEKGVAFMPGESFYPEGEPQTGTLRLNFTHASDEEAQKGLAILAEMIREVTPKKRKGLTDRS